MNTINLRNARAMLVRTAAVGAIGAAMLTGSAAIASAQTPATDSQQPLTTCVLHTQNRGVVFSQLSYSDCFQLMYSSPLNRPERNVAATLPNIHDYKWVAGHTHSSSDTDN